MGLEVAEGAAPVHKQYTPVAARGLDLPGGRGQRRPIQGLKLILAGNGRTAELNDDSWAVGACCRGRQGEYDGRGVRKTRHSGRRGVTAT